MSSHDYLTSLFSTFRLSFLNITHIPKRKSSTTQRPQSIDLHNHTFHDATMTSPKPQGSPVPPIGPPPEPSRLRLPGNYVSAKHPQAFHPPEELVIIESEFNDYKSAGHVSDTPVYRVVEKDGEYASFAIYYLLENVQTKEVPEQWREKDELRLFPGQMITDRWWDLDEKGRVVDKRMEDWDAEKLARGDDGETFGDEETLRRDVDENEREAVRRS